MAVIAPTTESERGVTQPLSMSLLAGAVVLGEDRVPSGRSRRRAAARPDEDAVTLASEAAALALPQSLERVGAVLLVTVTPPYGGGGSVQALAEILGCHGEVFALELSASARDGLAALRLAAALASSAGPVLVCAAHVGVGEPSAGDGAVALLLGGAGPAGAEGEGLAVITPAASTAIEVRDRWRLPGEVSWREGDKSFVQAIATERVAREALAGVPAALDAPAMIIGPDAQASAALERALDGPGDPVFAHTGVLGAAHPLLRLLAGLDGSPSLVVAMANGLGEVIHVAPTEVGGEAARTARERCERGGAHVDRALAIPATAGFDPFHSGPRAWRDRDVDLRLKGLVGPKAGPTIVPGRKHPTGTVVARTRDFVYPAAPSTELASVEMDAGGQFYGQVAMGEEVSLGDRVELVPRRLHQGGGMIQYFWKVRPCR